MSGVKGQGNGRWSVKDRGVPLPVVLAVVVVIVVVLVLVIVITPTIGAG
jgi:hypothetical protein